MVNPGSAAVVTVTFCEPPHGIEAGLGESVAVNDGWRIWTVIVPVPTPAGAPPVARMTVRAPTAAAPDAWNRNVALAEVAPTPNGNVIGLGTVVSHVGRGPNAVVTVIVPVPPNVVGGNVMLTVMKPLVCVGKIATPVGTVVSAAAASRAPSADAPSAARTSSRGSGLVRARAAAPPLPAPRPTGSGRAAISGEATRWGSGLAGMATSRVRASFMSSAARLAPRGLGAHPVNVGGAAKRTRRRRAVSSSRRWRRTPPTTPGGSRGSATAGRRGRPGRRRGRRRPSSTLGGGAPRTAPPSTRAR